MGQEEEGPDQDLRRDPYMNKHLEDLKQTEENGLVVDHIISGVKTIVKVQRNPTCLVFSV